MTDESERGAVYTKPEIVRTILDLAGYTADLPLHERRLLEPSFGGGDFLLPVLDRLLSACLSQPTSFNPYVPPASRTWHPPRSRWCVRWRMMHGYGGRTKMIRLLPSAFDAQVVNAVKSFWIGRVAPGSGAQGGIRDALLAGRTWTPSSGWSRG